MLTSLVAEVKWTFPGSISLPESPEHPKGPEILAPQKVNETSFQDRTRLLTVLMCVIQYYHTNLYPVERSEHLFSVLCVRSSVSGIIGTGNAETVQQLAQ